MKCPAFEVTQTMNITPVPLILTQQELEVPRTAAEMLGWVEEAHARFNTKELRVQAREGKHFANELNHEARPLALFAQRYFDASPQVTITHVIGNQNHDALVEDKRDRTESIRYLEVTTTLKTYDDALRMEILSKEGSVAAYGPVIAKGPKSSRTSLKADGVAREHAQIRADHLKLVQEVVERKAKMKYEPNTALVVAVDDSVPFSTQEDVRALDNLATKVLVPALKDTNFALMALEGSR